LPQNDISEDVRAVHGGEYENTVLGSNYFGLVPITSPLVFESTTLVTMPNSEFNVNDELAAAIGLHETAHTWLLGHCAANSCIMNLDVEPSAYIAASQSDRPFCTAHAVSLQGLSLLENTLNPILDTLPRP
jgi:hypothetical protein